MDHRDDLNRALNKMIRKKIFRPCNNQFSKSRHTARSSTMRMRGKPLRSSLDSAHSSRRCGSAVCSDVPPYLFNALQSKR